MTFLIQDIPSLHSLMDLLDDFSRISGLKVNPHKSHLLLLGNFKDPPESIRDIRIEHKVKILGVVYKTKMTEDEHYTLNFASRIAQIKRICDTWLNRRLSLKGKITLINSLMISILHYPCACSFTPIRVIAENEGDLYSLLPPPPASTLQTFQTNVDHMGQIPSIQPYFRKGSTGRTSLEQRTDSDIGKTSGLAGVAVCGYKANQRYHAHLRTALSLTPRTGPGVWLEPSFLQVLQIRSAIYCPWKRLLHSGRDPKAGSAPCIRTADKNLIDVSNATAKKIYAAIISFKLPMVSSQDKWNDVFPLGETNQEDYWKEVYTSSYHALRDTKLQTFRFKLTHRIIDVFLHA